MPAQFNEINAKRSNTQYTDVQAANKAGGCTDGFKKSLTKSPFVRQFEYGANINGYWNYNHMVLQLEDCVDVLKYLHGKIMTTSFCLTTQVAMISNKKMG